MTENYHIYSLSNQNCKELIGLAQVQAMEKYWARPQPTTTFFREVPGKFEVENNYGDH